MKIPELRDNSGNSRVPLKTQHINIITIHCVNVFMLLPHSVISQRTAAHCVLLLIRQNDNIVLIDYTKFKLIHFSEL